MRLWWWFYVVLGNKRTFGDIEDDEDDIFGSKKVPRAWGRHSILFNIGLSVGIMHAHNLHGI